MIKIHGKLFVDAILVGSLGMFSVWLLQPFNPWFFLLYIGPTAVGFCMLYGRQDRIDPLLFAPAVLLCGVGLTMVARLAPGLLWRQLVAYLVGLCSYLLLSIWGGRIRWERFGYLWGLLGALLLLGTSLFGVRVGGSRAWIRFLGFSFQPIELFKLLLILFLVASLTEESTSIVLRERRGLFAHMSLWGPSLLLWLLGVLALGIQRDLGGMILLSGIFWGTIYVAEGRLATVLIGLFLGLGGFTLSYCLFPHVQSRLGNWLDLWRGDQVYHQLQQGLFAAASGGFTGTGLGLGHPYLIPQVHTDFPLMAIWEELGLLGAVGILGLYMLMVVYLFKKAINSYCLRHRLLCAGVAVMIGLQVLLIAGGNLGLVPLTGITLPFISYGGSSVIVLWSALGLTGAIPRLRRQCRLEV
ncbi:MAG: FtsW/RodA/SpoVE family cell cycle protein [Limnochordia bacterium]|jgi:cell division protein FtsW (lipid II flippase)